MKTLKNGFKNKEGILFIANGKWFISLKDVEEYADKNGWRIANTEYYRGPKNNYNKRCLVTLNAK